MSRIRGIDPGEKIGWCDVEEVPGGLPRRVESGAVDRAEDLPAFAGVALVAVEMPITLHPAAFAPGKGRKVSPAQIVARVQGLIRAARVGQRILCAAQAGGVDTLEVDAAVARRALGVVIGGSRKGPPCEACSGSGADAAEVQPGAQLTPEAAEREAGTMRRRAAQILEENARRARGKKARLKELAAIRLRACAVFPCSVCKGAGERRPPSVDQQIATLLPGLVTGWAERSNVHERDAAVVALHGFRIGGRDG